MSGSVRLDTIRQFAEEIATREGCYLYDLEFFDGPQRTLRVYIGKDNVPISVEDCANVSRALNLRLDVEDIIPGGAYELEVSSPGMDRKLTQLWHFEHAVGETIRLRYRGETETSGNYEGRLTGVSGSILTFENSKGPKQLDYSNIQSARVLVVGLFPQNKPGGRKKKR